MTAGELFTKYGSDKNTNHNYGEFYDSLIPDRESVKFVLEIGTATGAALLAWRDMYPNAVLVGFDRENSVIAGEKRIEFFKGDLKDRTDLLGAVGSRKFDLIVEDASHEFDDNLRTLFWLWPHVASGGIYVIEEFQYVKGHMDCFDLFKGCTLYETPAMPDHKPSSIGNELLVVLRKPL